MPSKQPGFASSFEYTLNKNSVKTKQNKKQGTSIKRHLVSDNFIQM